MSGVILSNYKHGCFVMTYQNRHNRIYETDKDCLIQSHPFYNDTFLFHEEEFLYLRSVRDNLITLYSPSIELIHKEGQSLNKEFKDDYKKLIFRNKEIVKSLELLKKEMMR